MFTFSRGLCEGFPPAFRVKQCTRYARPCLLVSFKHVTDTSKQMRYFNFAHRKQFLLSHLRPCFTALSHSVSSSSIHSIAEKITKEIISPMLRFIHCCDLDCIITRRSHHFDHFHWSNHSANNRSRCISKLWWWSCKAWTATLKKRSGQKLRVVLTQEFQLIR